MSPQPFLSGEIKQKSQIDTFRSSITAMKNAGCDTNDLEGMIID